MTWLHFIVAFPIAMLGFLFEWALDMFNRGRRWYDWLCSE